MSEDNESEFAVLPTEPHLPDELIELTLHINAVLEKLHGEPCTFALAYLYGGSASQLARMQRLSNCGPARATALFQIASKVPYSNPKMVETNEL